MNTTENKQLQKVINLFEKDRLISSYEPVKDGFSVCIAENVAVRLSTKNDLGSELKRLTDSMNLLRKRK